MADSTVHGDLNHLSAAEKVRVAIVVFISIALYNVLELNFIVFGTFKQRHGLYFWSFIVAIWGIAFNAIGYLLKHLSLTSSGYLYATIIVIGWCAMVTGQSVVLYSRLYIVVRNRTTLRLVLAMIIINAIAMHIPVTILVYGAFSANPKPFEGPYSVYEKVQLTVFFLQEAAISALYVFETVKMLRLENGIRNNAQTRRMMSHLIYVNIIVILLDITILALEFANYYDLQTAWKPLAYSVKLKAEFSILNKLVDLARTTQNSNSYARSNTAGHGGGNVALDTFERRQSKTDTPNGDVGYKAHVNACGFSGGKPTGSGVTRTTEIIVKSDDRPKDRDLASLDSLEDRPGLGDGGRNKGSASSVSSEVQFARGGY